MILLKLILIWNPFRAHGAQGMKQYLMALTKVRLPLTFLKSMAKEVALLLGREVCCKEN